ncbi:YkvA family protein [Thalassospira australica]|uniref:YkvA family protein n=1 Tax=Thalassospira australica TaxID=1528106 RepID=UPI000AE5515D|nr:DUF1232 domain-containing protein [Thalassospira australica]
MGLPKTSAWMIVPNLLRTLMRGDVALKSKLILIAGLVYLISPVDLLPDVIVGFGWLDDLVIVPLLGWLSYRSLPKKVQEDVIVPADETSKKKTQRVYLYLGILIVAVIVIALMSGGENSLNPVVVPQVGD